ncbi:hypothetical protein FB566_3185 [Stackebrandtia endophytica]|uniref:Uncharacterized protein n=2 Tax=Stackebrandtia endophytica TaxID=1496996 RepID=A0A543AYH0_9ACTN|nr:hypothetical protein FB566_3185 [Stackebrandtia endophytica]
MWRIYLRSRRLHLAAIGWLVTVAASIWWGDHAVVIPSFGPQGRELVLAVLILPLPAVAGALATLSDDLNMWEHHARRRVRWWDLVVVTGCLLAYIVGLGLGVGDFDELPGVAVLGALWWIALGLVAAIVFGRRLAWALPVVVMLAMLLFGTPEKPAPWAVPFHQATLEKTVLAIGVYSAAAGFYLWAAHRPVTRLTRWWGLASQS